MADRLYPDIVAISFFLLENRLIGFLQEIASLQFFKVLSDLGDRNLFDFSVVNVYP